MKALVAIFAFLAVAYVIGNVWIARVGLTESAQPPNTQFDEEYTQPEISSALQSSGLTTESNFELQTFPETLPTNNSSYVDSQGINLTELGSDEYRDLLSIEKYDWIHRDLAPLKKSARSNPRDAYLLFMIYLDCRTAAGMDESAYQSNIQGLQAMINEESGVGGDHELLRQHQEYYDYFLAYFDRCSSTDEDFQALAFDAITLAASAGHLIAQIDYMRIGRMLITNDDFFISHPDALDQYLSTAQFSMQGSIASGHPQAFTEVALQYLKGGLVEADPFKAYAYAHAASLAFEDFVPAINRRGDMHLHVMEQASETLTGLEQRHARMSGRDLYRTNRTKPQP